MLSTQHRDSIGSRHATHAQQNSRPKRITVHPKDELCATGYHFLNKEVVGGNACTGLIFKRASYESRAIDKKCVCLAPVTALLTNPPLNVVEC